MLYTRKGDDGTSGLYGKAARVPKDSSIYEALGSLDELNALLGICYASMQEKTAALQLNPEFPAIIRAVQEHLFIVQAHIAGADKRLEQGQVDWIERTIDRLEQEIVAPRSFLIAGSTSMEALLDYARAVARRTERSVVRAREIAPLTAPAYAYVNRLSSLLYVLARYTAKIDGVSEPSPTYPT